MFSYILSFRTLKRMRITIDFKHIRFKSKNKIPKQEVILTKEIRNLRIQNLAESLNCNNFTAHEIITKNRNILALNNYIFYQNVNFCKRYLKLSDLVEFPHVLSLNPSLLQHRYFSLKELGCMNVTASDLLRFLHIVKRTPKILEEDGFSFNQNFDFLTKYLDNSDKIEISSKLLCMYDDGSSLWKIKEAMNAEFLAAKLGCSIGKAHQMLHNYPPLRVQSVLNTNQLLDILLEKLDFSFSKIYSSLSLLSLCPETVENFLSEIPEILGVNTVYIAKKLPRILKCSVDSIRKIEDIMKHFNITEAQLMCCPKIMAFSPNTLQERLTNLCDSKDFTMLKSYKKFLWLVYYYNNLNSRLEALKEMDIPCSISMFIDSKSKFNRNLCVSECRTHINDICFYLSELFNIDEKEILTRLREYPNYHNSSLVNCRDVIEFLLDSKVTKKQIFNGIGIIFYDIDAVKLYFNDLKNHPECQPFEEWKSHYNLIQLLIYAIEVDTGFQGNRLYKTKCKMDEQEELLVNYSTN